MREHALSASQPSATESQSLPSPSAPPPPPPPLRALPAGAGAAAATPPLCSAAPPPPALGSLLLPASEAASEMCAPRHDSSMWACAGGPADPAPLSAVLQTSPGSESPPSLLCRARVDCVAVLCSEAGLPLCLEPAVEPAGDPSAEPRLMLDPKGAPGDTRASHRARACADALSCTWSPGGNGPGAGRALASAALARARAPGAGPGAGLG